MDPDEQRRDAYRRKTLVELQRTARQRYQDRLIVKDKSKEDLIDILVQKDQSDESLQNFRFLNLSGEIQTLIYEYLLLIPDEKGEYMDRCSCHPEILAVSKKVYKDARGVLYRANTGKLLITNHKTAESSDGTTAGSIVVIPDAPGQRLGRTIYKWQQYEHLANCARFSKIIVTLKLDKDKSDWKWQCVYTKASYELYVLVALLAQSPIEKEEVDVHIEFTADGGAQIQPDQSPGLDLQDMLFPLRLVESVTKIQINGTPIELTCEVPGAPLSTEPFGFHMLQRISALRTASIADLERDYIGDGVPLGGGQLFCHGGGEILKKSGIDRILGFNGVVGPDLHELVEEVYEYLANDGVFPWLRKPSRLRQV